MKKAKVHENSSDTVDRDNYNSMRVFFRAGIMKVFDTSTTGELFRSKVSPKSVKIDDNVNPVEGKLKVAREEEVRVSETRDPLNTSSKISIQSLSKNKIKYGLDDDKNIVMQLVDPESNEVIRQIPPEEQVRIAKAIEKILEESSDKSETAGNAGVDTVI